MTSRQWAAFTLAVLSAGACGKAASDAIVDAGSTGLSSSGGGYGSSSGGGPSTGVDATLGGDDTTEGGAGDLDAGTALDGAGAQAEAAPLVVCGENFLAPGNYTRTLTIDGGARTYYVHIPPGAVGPGPAPLVFGLHGGGMTAVGDGGLAFENFAHVQPKSDSAGFVLIEPEGTPALPGSQPGILDVWNAGNCCEEAEQQNQNVDDVSFVSAMIDAISLETCIDPKRVFATGISNGAMLSHRLACQLSNRIAAIAAVSGGMGNRDLDSLPSPTTLFECNPTRPVPVLHIHGTQDACYPFDGGWGPLSLVTFYGAPQTVGDWVTRNGCSAGAATQVFSNGAANCFLYPCPQSAEVEFCTIDGGGHYWPGGGDWTGSEIVCGSDQGVRSSDIIANDAMWAWFMAHPMP
jgi:polyhydroxybutyrate depolymerase